MWQILQDNLPAGGLANTLALVQFSVLGVFVIKTISVLHTTSSRNGIRLITTMGLIDTSPQCRSNLGLPVSLRRMGLIAPIQKIWVTKVGGWAP